MNNNWRAREPESKSSERSEGCNISSFVNGFQYVSDRNKKSL